MQGFTCVSVCKRLRQTVKEASVHCVGIFFIYYYTLHTQRRQQALRVSNNHIE